MSAAKTVLLCHLSASKPVPYGTGENITIWNDYNALKESGYEIIRVEFGNKNHFVDNDSSDEIVQIELSPFPTLSHLNWIEYQNHNILKPLLDPVKYFYPQFLGDPVKQFKQILNKYQPSFIFCENIGPVIVTHETGIRIPAFCTLLDMDYILKFGKSISAKSDRKANLLKLPLAIMREKWKKNLHRKCYHKIVNQTKIRAVSEVDHFRLKCAGGDSIFFPIPVGISPGKNRLEKINKRLISTAKNNQGRTVTIIHIGTVKSSHNSAGLRFFFNKCLSQLTDKIDFKVRIIGNKKFADPDILKYSEDKHVEFTGYVDDLEDELVNADFVIVPPGFDTGFRTKLPEAFAYGLPAVTNSEVIRGVGLKPDDPRVIIADTPEEYADACNRLIEDSELRCRMGKIALETWEREFSAEKVIKDTAEWIKANAN